jgi:hypothetical protein
MPVENKEVDSNIVKKTEKEKNKEGKQIGGYIIGKTKGKGTFGKVK